MGINYNQISQCTNQCDCEAIGNVILKGNNKGNLDTEKKKPKRNSFARYKDKFFSNQIIDYINDNKSYSKNDNDNNISIHNNNNLNTYRSTNMQSNLTNKNNVTNNKEIENNNNEISNNINYNNNNVTVEKKGKFKKDSSIYEDNKDSFVKMEEKNLKKIKNLIKL